MFGWSTSSLPPGRRTRRHSERAWRTAALSGRCSKRLEQNTTSTDPSGTADRSVAGAWITSASRAWRTVSGFRSTAILLRHRMALMNSQVPAPRSTTVSVSATYRWKNRSHRTSHMRRLNAMSSSVKRRRYSRERSAPSVTSSSSPSAFESPLISWSPRGGRTADCHPEQRHSSDRSRSDAEHRGEPVGHGAWSAPQEDHRDSVVRDEPADRRLVARLDPYRAQPERRLQPHVVRRPKARVPGGRAEVHPGFRLPVELIAVVLVDDHRGLAGAQLGPVPVRREQRRDAEVARPQWGAEVRHDGDGGGRHEQPPKNRAHRLRPSSRRPDGRGDRGEQERVRDDPPRTGPVEQRQLLQGGPRERDAADGQLRSDREDQRYQEAQP